MTKPCLPDVSGLAFGFGSAITDEPIVSAHGHDDPAWWADEVALPDPAALLMTPGHDPRRSGVALHLADQVERGVPCRAEAKRLANALTVELARDA